METVVDIYTVPSTLKRWTGLLVKLGQINLDIPRLFRLQEKRFLSHMWLDNQDVGVGGGCPFPVHNRVARILLWFKSGLDFLIDPVFSCGWMELLLTRNCSGNYVHLKNLQCRGTVDDEQCKIHAASIDENDNFEGLSLNSAVSHDDNTGHLSRLLVENVHGHLAMA